MGMWMGSDLRGHSWILIKLTRLGVLLSFFFSKQLQQPPSEMRRPGCHGEGPGLPEPSPSPASVLSGFSSAPKAKLQLFRGRLTPV